MITCILIIQLDCSVFICDFHREQSWDRWLNKKCNGVSTIKADVLSRLRRIARASTEEMCSQAIDALKEWDVWQDPLNTKLATYIEKYWLAIKEV